MNNSETHTACAEVIERDGGKAVCCDCNGHACKKTPSTWEERFDKEIGYCTIDDCIDLDKVKSFIAQEREEAKREERERIVKIVGFSRTTDETHGVGRLENHARWQAIADILALEGTNEPDYGQSRYDRPS